jgi:hypothetical protein
MYYGDTYPFNWRKPILDDEQEHFWEKELTLLKQICDPTVIKLKKLGSYVTEFRVQLDDHTGKALAKRLEYISDYGLTLGIDPKGPESPDPDRAISKKGFFFHGFIFYVLQAQIHREEILKVMARILKKSYQDEPDPGNPWHRMKRLGPHAFQPYLPDDPEEFERMKNWQEMKEQLRRKAIPKRITGPNNEQPVSNTDLTDIDASLDTPSLGHGQRHRYFGQRNQKSPEPRDHRFREPRQPRDHGPWGP